MRSKLTLAVIIAVSCLSSARFAQADTIYSQDFESATAGQSVTLSPIEWVASMGDMKVGSGLHTGWSGNAISGDLGGINDGLAYKSLTLPTDKLLTFTADVYVKSGTGYGSLGYFRNGNWCACWTFGSNGYATFRPVGDYGWSFANTDKAFSLDSTVTVQTIVDPVNNQTWGRLISDAGDFTTPVYGDSVMPLGIYTYSSNGSGRTGIDVDNIIVSTPNAAPVPEPSGLVVLGLGGLTTLNILRKRIL